jgi:threonine dehydrogenase-like Zn-dependent dehydrogenase
MGSAAEFKALCELLTEKKVPLDGLVDTVFKGLESADEAFEKMKHGGQFGITAGTKQASS